MSRNGTLAAGVPVPTEHSSVQPMRRAMVAAVLAVIAVLAGVILAFGIGDDAVISEVPARVAPGQSDYTGDWKDGLVDGTSDDAAPSGDWKDGFIGQ